MTSPLLTNSPTVLLEVDTDRRLRADLLLAPDRQNAVEVRDDGIYMESFTRSGSVIRQNSAGAQTLPLYGASAVPSSSAIIYNVADTDADGAWSSTDPTKLTIPKTGMWLLSAIGKFIQQGGAFVTFTYAAWLARNGDEMKPIAAYTPPSWIYSQPVNAGSVQASEQVHATYKMTKLLRMEAGEYVTTQVFFIAAAAAAPTVTMTSNTWTAPQTGATHVLGAVRMAPA